MKTHLALCGCFIAIVLFAADTSPQSGQPVRYALVPSTVTMSDSTGNTLEVKGLFRLDSLTGRTFMLVLHIDGKTNLVRAWAPLLEPTEHLLHQLKP